MEVFPAESIPETQDEILDPPKWVYDLLKETMNKNIIVNYYGRYSTVLPIYFVTNYRKKLSQQLFLLDCDVFLPFHSDENWRLKRNPCVLPCLALGDFVFSLLLVVASPQLRQSKARPCSLEMELKDINTREETWRTIKTRDKELEIKYEKFKTVILPLKSASFGDKVERSTEFEEVSYKIKGVVLVDETRKEEARIQPEEKLGSSELQQFGGELNGSTGYPIYLVEDFYVYLRKWTYKYLSRRTYDGIKYYKKRPTRCPCASQIPTPPSKTSVSVKGSLRKKE
ncbi:unnamed protein product [Orchesella dallaii]|uniref:Uncharacterized protein n=1 Tax=Orchesella dallaii TaxID=48710 RepID=A0ABP1RHY3_9HEXA